MTNLLVYKEYVKRFYARYEEYIVPLLKFVLGLILFATINSRLGYMERLNNTAVVLVAALLCSFMPLGMMALLCAVFLLLHAYALSVECTAVLLLILLFIVVVYFRFSPKSNLILLLTPLLFVWKVPYVMPIAAGLFGSPVSAVPLACGVVIYYMLAYMAGNAPVLGGGEGNSMLQRFKDVTNGVLGNREMLIVIVAFAATVLMVYAIKRLSIDYSRAIAVLVGTLSNIVIMLVGDLMYDAQFSISGVILGSVLSAAAALIMQFFYFTLDYARTEKVQFEDDEYYYYVKAVPKMSVAAPVKTVKKITTQRANRNVRHGHTKGKVRK